MNTKGRAIFILPPHGDDLRNIKRPAWGISRMPPISLITIGSYLDKCGHDVKILDGRFYLTKYQSEDYIEYLLKDIENFHPDIIGINILTALFYNAEYISREIKNRFPSVMIVAGGVHPSVEPTLTFKQNQYIDAICIGPGEEVSLDMLSASDMGNINGLMLRSSVDKYVKRDVVMDIDKYPFPNYNLINDVNYYTDFTIAHLANWGYKAIGELTSRSCPYSCKFCASDWSKPCRHHSADYVVGLARHLSMLDVEVIEFLDDTIAMNPSRLMNICNGFIESHLFYPYTQLRWRCTLRANEASPSMLKLMKQAGCLLVGIGMETGSDKMLQLINKKTTVDMNMQAYNNIRDAGLFVGASFMVGIYGETENDIKETVKCIGNMKYASVGVGVFRPLPGSPFYYELIGKGIIEKEKLDWSDLGNFSVMSKESLCSIPKGKLGRLFDDVFNIANANAWISIHEDSFNKRINLIREIAKSVTVKIVRGDKYDSTEHTQLRPVALSLVVSTFLIHLYTKFPYELRRIIRYIVSRVSEMSIFRKILWRY